MFKKKEDCQQYAVNFGYVWLQTIQLLKSVATADSSAAYEGADKMGQPLLHHCDTIGQQTHPPEDAAPELGHN